MLAISPSLPFVSPTVATPTDAMQRDNQQREIVTQVNRSEAFARESGLGQNADKAPLAGAETFANQLAGARQEAEHIRRRAEKNSAKAAAGDKPLDNTEQAKVDELKKRDAEVRRHEQTHASVGGQYAGSPRYEMEQGADGRSYAVGGEVDIDVTPIADDPAATIQKMQTVQRAALAVEEPSAADRRIANEAAQQEQKARQELAEEQDASKEQEPTDERAQHIAQTYQNSFVAPVSNFAANA